jgi:hypothetical protein
MRRSLQSQPTRLHHYLSDLQVNWYLVRNHIVNRPEEASSRSQHGATALYKALYRRVEDYPSTTIVDALLDAYPPAMWDCNDDQSPLKAACWRRASLSILQRLILCRPSRPNDLDALHALWKSYENLFGDNLIPIILEGSREGTDILVKMYTMLEYCTIQTISEYHNLHSVAANPSCSLEMLRLSYSYFPDQIRQFDMNGRLPLHYLVDQSHESSGNQSSSSDENLLKVEQMLQWYPQAAMLWEKVSRYLPLHLAIMRGLPWNVIQLLVRAAPETITEGVGLTRLYPFQFAACSKDCSLTVVFELIKLQPCLLVDDIGPDREKNDNKVLNKRDRNYAERVATQNLEGMLQQACRRDDTDFWKDLQSLLCFRIPKRKDWYALHAAASMHNCPLGLLELTTILNRDELQLRDKNWNLPLHLILNDFQLLQRDDKPGQIIDQHEQSIKIRIVMRYYPEAAMHRDLQGRLPLHMAIDAGYCWQSLRILLNGYPAAIGERNNDGFYPFQIAALNPKSTLTEVYELLLAAPNLLRTFRCLHNDDLKPYTPLRVPIAESIFPLSAES